MGRGRGGGGVTSPRRRSRASRGGVVAPETEVGEEGDEVVP